MGGSAAWERVAEGDLAAGGETAVVGGSAAWGRVAAGGLAAGEKIVEGGWCSGLWVAAAGWRAAPGMTAVVWALEVAAVAGSVAAESWGAWEVGLEAWRTWRWWASCTQTAPHRK